MSGGNVSGSVGIGTTSPNSKLEVADIDSQFTLKGTITGAPVYQSWYNSSNVRRGYFGFSAPSNSDLRLVNEEVGNIYITPNNGSTIISSTITASPATLSNHVVVKSQLDAVKPYKVYTALLSQTGTNAPVATVLENTLGGTVVWSYSSAGIFSGTCSIGAFTVNKTIGFIGSNANFTTNNQQIGLIRSSDTSISLQTYISGVQTNGVLNSTSIEIRVYL